MSQGLPAPSGSMTGRRVAFLAVSFALPSWLISIIFHAGLLGGLATLTWTVSRQAPNQEFTVGIMLKKDTPQGQAFESQDSTYATYEESVNHPAQFLPDAELSSVAQALPRMPEVDLSAIGLAGSMLKGTGEMLAVPVISPPVKRNVFLNRATHGSLGSGCCARSQPWKLPWLARSAWIVAAFLMAASTLRWLRMMAASARSRARSGSP